MVEPYHTCTQSKKDLSQVFTIIVHFIDITIKYNIIQYIRGNIYNI